MKTVVYTAITDSYDSLRPQPLVAEEFIAFLDGNTNQNIAPWKIVNHNLSLSSPTLAARWYKMMPHRLFPDCDYSLWIDGRIEITGNESVKQIADQYLKEADIVLFKHRGRNCIYEEAKEVIRRGLDDQKIVDKQITEYSQQGYPAHNGLGETTVLLRRHNKLVEEFNEAWWKELCTYSFRDQISFNYLAHRMGLRVTYFPGNIDRNPLFKRHFHKSRLQKWLGI